MSRPQVAIVATILAIACCPGLAWAKVGPVTAGAAPTRIAPPTAAMFVAPNILPRLLVTSLSTR